MKRLLVVFGAVAVAALAWYFLMPQSINARIAKVAADDEAVAQQPINLDEMAKKYGLLYVDWTRGEGLTKALTDAGPYAKASSLAEFLERHNASNVKYFAKVSKIYLDGDNTNRPQLFIDGQPHLVTQIGTVIAEFTDDQGKLQQVQVVCVRYKDKIDVRQAGLLAPGSGTVMTDYLCYPR